MARYTVIFFVIAVVTAFFGYGDIREDVAEIAKYVCFIFSVAFFISLLLSIEVKRQ
jgi:uncharacterized membrane protein YtjA (UPF0391 family)